MGATQSFPLPEQVKSLLLCSSCRRPADRLSSLLQEASSAAVRRPRRRAPASLARTSSRPSALPRGWRRGAGLGGQPRGGHEQEEEQRGAQGAPPTRRQRGDAAARGGPGPPRLPPRPAGRKIRSRQRFGGRLGLSPATQPQSVPERVTAPGERSWSSCADPTPSPKARTGRRPPSWLLAMPSASEAAFATTRAGSRLSRDRSCVVRPFLCSR